MYRNVNYFSDFTFLRCSTLQKFIFTEFMPKNLLLLIIQLEVSFALQEEKNLEKKRVLDFTVTLIADKIRQNVIIIVNMTINFMESI